MTVVSDMLGLVRVFGGQKNGLTQHFPVGKRNTEDRLENPRFMAPLPMSKVQHIILDLRAEIGAVAVGKLHHSSVCQIAQGGVKTHGLPRNVGIKRMPSTIIRG